MTNQRIPFMRVLGTIARASKYPLLFAGATLAVLTGALPVAQAMDTDIFTAQSSAGAAPNVLIILDNTSNWARQNQHWADGPSQGQSEAAAIKQVIQNLPGNINIGLLEFVTGGPATDDGGYVRFAISAMGQGQGTAAATNRTNFSNTLTTIYNNINDPQEKTNSTMAYGNLMYDAYNYLSGSRPFAASGDVVASLADSRGYTANYTQFRSPLSTSTSCGTTYIIFIGNPAARGPTSDSSANTQALTNAGGEASQLKLPVYTETTRNLSTNLGYSSACYTSAPTGTPTDYAASCPSSSNTYDSCSYSTTDTSSALAACTTGAALLRCCHVVGHVDLNRHSTNTATTDSCYASSSIGAPATRGRCRHAPPIPA